MAQIYEAGLIIRLPLLRFNLCIISNVQHIKNIKSKTVA